MDIGKIFFTITLVLFIATVYNYIDGNDKMSTIDDIETGTSARTILYGDVDIDFITALII